MSNTVGKLLAFLGALLILSATAIVITNILVPDPTPTISAEQLAELVVDVNEKTAERDAAAAEVSTINAQLVDENDTLRSQATEANENLATKQAELEAAQAALEEGVADFNATPEPPLAGLGIDNNSSSNDDANSNDDGDDANSNDDDANSNEDTTTATTETADHGLLIWLADDDNLSSLTTAVTTAFPTAEIVTTDDCDNFATFSGTPDLIYVDHITKIEGLVDQNVVKGVNCVTTLSARFPGIEIVVVSGRSVADQYTQFENVVFKQNPKTGNWTNVIEAMHQILGE